MSRVVKVSPLRLMKRKSFSADVHRVCLVDMSIYNAATTATVDTSGTVMACRYHTCSRHSDRRNALARQVAAKQAQARLLKKGQRYCMALHRRIQGCCKDAVLRLASEIAAFAAAQGAWVVVIAERKG